MLLTLGFPSGHSHVCSHVPDLSIQAHQVHLVFLCRLIISVVSNCKTQIIICIVCMCACVCVCVLYLDEAKF